MNDLKLGKHFTKNLGSIKLINKFKLESNSSAKRPKKSFDLGHQHVPADLWGPPAETTQIHRVSQGDPLCPLCKSWRTPTFSSWNSKSAMDVGTQSRAGYNRSTHPSGVRQDHCYYPYYLKQMAHHVCFSPKYPTVYWKNSIIPARFLSIYPVIHLTPILNCLCRNASHSMVNTTGFCTCSSK